MEDVKNTAETATEETVAEELKTEKKKKEPKEEKRLKGEIAELRKALEEKEAALAEEKDKYLRLFAEYDNFRRRSKSEREAAYTDAVSDALAEFMPLLDNLERAAEAQGDEGAVRTGLEMTVKSAHTTLEKLGVTAFGAKGDTFNPEMHNAVMHVEDETLGEGEITDVFQRGYRRGDRIIRYAMVKVAN